MWMREAMARANINQPEMAERLTAELGRSFEKAAVNKMVIVDPKPGQKVRNIKGDEMLAIAKITGFPLPPSFLEAPRTAPGSELTPKPSTGLVRAVKAGTVAAGLFREHYQFDQSEKIVRMETPDPEFPNARLVFWDAEGDSMNALKPIPLLPGMEVVCVDYDDLDGRMPPRTGMIVVIQRSRDGGHLIEWSVKQIELYQDRIEFHPRSTNPIHKPIIVTRDMQADDGQEIRIVALVRRLSANV